MRKIYLLLLIILNSCSSISQNCNEIHVGNFELNSTVSGKTKIHRTEKLQIETNEFMKVKSQYDINWVDDCTYQLKNRKLLSGNEEYNGEPNDIFTVKILKIEGSKIFVRTSANFTDSVFESQIDIVK